VLVLPDRALLFWNHYLARDEASGAFQAVVRHELGHIEAWDDVLFLPGLSYLVGSWALVGLGAQRALAGRLSVPLVLEHVALLVGLTVALFHVVRRLEAFCDAFAAVTGGSERAIRLALGVLGSNEPRSSTLLPAFHFAFSARLELLRSRGMAFLQMRQGDLILLTILNVSLNGDLVGAEWGGGLGEVVNAFSTLTITSFSFLALAGLLVARRGRGPAWHEFLLPCALLVVAAMTDRVLRQGEDVSFSLALGFIIALAEAIGSVLPLLLFVYVWMRLARAVLASSITDARRDLITAAITVSLAVATIRFALQAVANHLGPSGAASGGELGRYGAAVVFGLVPTKLLLYAGLLLAMGARANRMALRFACVCRYCGAPLASAARARHAACSGCGALSGSEQPVHLES
jgi:hypothetical protein